MSGMLYELFLELQDLNDLEESDRSIPRRQGAIDREENESSRTRAVQLP